MAEIETTRLFLRRPISEDISTLENLWRDERVREFLGGTVSEELIDQKVAALQNHWELHQFGLGAVLEKKANQLVGLCGLHYSEDGIEVSYMFFPHFWGKGYAHEAVIANLSYGFKALQLQNIIAITQAANAKSCKLLMKVGMNHISSFERYNAVQGLYRLTQDEWLRKSRLVL